MKELDHIIEEQALLLKMNGYSEKHLRNGEAEGSYKEHLKTALQDLLNSNDSLLDIEPFRVKLFGFFNNKKDIVLFTLAYDYDPLLAQITLKEIEATLNNTPLAVPIEKGSDVWTSQELYERVKLLSTTIDAKQENEKLLHQQNIVHHEIKLLSEHGYLSNGLEEHFITAIKAATGNPNHETHFKITGKLKYGPEHDSMTYKLHYSYHPGTNHLKFKSVFAKLGHASETFLGTNRRPVPMAKDLFEYLAGLHKAQTANNIISKTEANVRPTNQSLSK